MLVIMHCLEHLRRRKLNVDRRPTVQRTTYRETKPLDRQSYRHKAAYKAKLQAQTHLKGKVFDSMLTREVLQLCPLLAVYFCNLSRTGDVLQGGLSQKGGLHDPPQLEMALAMSCVQCLVTNELGDGVGPLSCCM